MDFLGQAIKDHFRWKDLIRPALTLEQYQQSFPSEGYEPFELVRPKLKIGIEVEVENVRNHLRPDVIRPDIWQVKEDGSLRNGGYEFVSLPICDQMIPWACNYLFNHYLPNKSDFSERTSIHVHVNVRSWTTGDVLNLMLLYIVFEKLLYRFAGSQRYKNIFCVPIQETKLPLILSNYLANGNFSDMVMQWSKYSGLNLLPIRTYGTVEYRHMKGHRDVHTLLTWINILQQLHKAADSREFNVLFNTIKTLNSTSYYEQFVRDMFQGQAEHVLSPNLQKDMEYGVSVVKAIRPPSPFLTRLIDQISNMSPLLQGLHLSETATKKAKAKKEVGARNIPAGFVEYGNVPVQDAQAARPEFNWMADFVDPPRRAPAGQQHEYGDVWCVTDMQGFRGVRMYLNQGDVYTDVNGQARRVGID